MRSAVEDFIKCTGNYSHIQNKEVLVEEVLRLIPLIQEELDELSEATNLHWVEGILDATLDMRVYNYQLQSLLERLGCDVSPAEEAVDANNSLKYTTSWDLAIKWLSEHRASCLQKGEPCLLHICVTEVDNETYYCLKDGTGKVRKNVDFPRVELDKFVPVECGGKLGLED